ncbi:dual specificity protein phosphatase family protein [Shinella granuli]|uniref:Tyrosine phosphatase family protein n=1 Tax=Shinella granuli TaxID=323621 RepID=A0A4R2CZC6_SHIGR|nr:dual specificity protein phosphatase family protein [Shinella granuli]TCN46656.1 tyrosine phosphatase family protein [Shinella granuli]
MKRFLKWGALTCGALGVALGSYLVAIQLTGNFATVVPGEVYRSNQPTPGEIAAYAARYRIRTIVNLRGRNERAAWYRNEVAAARSLGLTLIDFPMQADQRLDPKAADELATLLRDAPRPILIHCRSGADRTGLASVIYLARIARVDEETAERQLSIRYGHIGIPFLSPTYAMDESWEALEEAARSAG